MPSHYLLAVTKINKPKDTADTARDEEAQYMLAKEELDLDAFIALVVERMALLTSADGVCGEGGTRRDGMSRSGRRTCPAYRIAPKNEQ